MAKELKKGYVDDFGNRMITVKQFRKELNKVLKNMDMDDNYMNFSKVGFLFFVDDLKGYGHRSFNIKVGTFNDQLEVYLEETERSITRNHRA